MPGIRSAYKTTFQTDATPAPVAAVMTSIMLPNTGFGTITAVARHAIPAAPTVQAITPAVVTPAVATANASF